MVTMNIEKGTKVYYDMTFWTVNNTRTIIDGDRFKHSIQLKAAQEVSSDRSKFEWVNVDDFSVSIIDKETIHIVPKERISHAEPMPNTGTEKAQKAEECSRCGNTLGEGSAFWIDETLGYVTACKECAEPLQAAHEKLSNARDAFVRMVYEHPGHGEKAPSVVGHVVMAARQAAPDELKMFGWEDSDGTAVLVLSSGAVIIPSADWAKNNVGVLFGISYEDKLLEFC